MTPAPRPTPSRVLAALAVGLAAIGASGCLWDDGSEGEYSPWKAGPPAPDLIIDTIAPDPTPRKGADILIHVIVRNNGSQASTACVVSFDLITGTTATALPNQPCGVILPGGTRIVTFQASIPGTYPDDEIDFRIMVDRNEQVAETNEINNLVQVTIPVLPAAAG